MKSSYFAVSLFFASLTVYLSSTAALAADTVTFVDGVEQVVCITSGTLSVRSDDLNQVLFFAKRGDRVKVFQGWGDVKKTKVIGGVTYVYMKVQFPDREDEDVSIGWVAENYIKERSACAGLEPPPPPPPPPFTGIDDPRCCEFPLGNRPTASYTSAPRAFGSSRSGGSRKHAACDLYRSKNDPIFSVADGIVIRNLYFFYLGTYALEVKHAGGFVVRYGELTGKTVTSLNQRLTAGQVVGFMGKTTCCVPMLHFELYSGAKSGSLSGGGPYQRRSDLMNPTAYLLKWEEAKFRDHR